MGKHQGLGKLQENQRIRTEQKIMQYLEVMQPAYTRQIVKHTGLDSHAIINALRRLENKNLIVIFQEVSSHSNSKIFYCKKTHFKKLLPKIKTKKKFFPEDLDNNPIVSKFIELENNVFTYSLKIYEIGYSPDQDPGEFYFKLLKKQIKLNMSTSQLAKIFHYGNKISLEELAKQTCIKKIFLLEALDWCDNFLVYHENSWIYFKKFVQSKGLSKKYEKLLTRLKNLMTFK